MTPDAVHPAPTGPAAALPEGFRIALDPRVKRWADGSILIGGSPWRVSRIKPAVQDLVRRLANAGGDGLSLTGPLDLAAGRQLLHRGFALPLRGPGPREGIQVVIPAMDHPDNLEAVLASLGDAQVTVIDDGSRVPADLADVTGRHGAELVVHPTNRGPAAARNTGLAATTSPIVAFIDSDCVAPPDWPESLLAAFDDPAVAAVAPRVVPLDTGFTVLEKYEATRSSLDMGTKPELVRPGARLGFVPTASLLVRRSALVNAAFDEELRLGEDVDLIWRLTEAGWLVQYDPTSVVQHRTRAHPRDWLVRRYQYGTSAADLQERHPEYLSPAHLSSWNLASLALISARRPALATAVTALAAALLWRQLADVPRSPALAGRTVTQGVVADAAAIGHALRREWWPVGALALVAAPRSRVARVATTCMIAPLAYEWVTTRPSLDPIRYCGLRLIDDAAYGSGVISAAIRHRSARVLLPVIRLPWTGGRDAARGRRTLKA